MQGLGLSQGARGLIGLVLQQTLHEGCLCARPHVGCAAGRVRGPAREEVLATHGARGPRRAACAEQEMGCVCPSWESLQRRRGGICLAWLCVALVVYVLASDKQMFIYLVHTFGTVTRC